MCDLCLLLSVDLNPELVIIENNFVTVVYGHSPQANPNNSGEQKPGLLRPHTFKVFTEGCSQDSLLCLRIIKFMWQKHGPYYWILIRPNFIYSSNEKDNYRIDLFSPGCLFVFADSWWRLKKGIWAILLWKQYQQSIIQEAGWDKFLARSLAWIGAVPTPNKSVHGGPSLWSSHRLILRRQARKHSGHFQFWPSCFVFVTRRVAPQGPPHQKRHPSRRRVTSFIPNLARLVLS